MLAGAFSAAGAMMSETVRSASGLRGAAQRATCGQKSQISELRTCRNESAKDWVVDFYAAVQHLAACSHSWIRHTRADWRKIPQNSELPSFLSFCCLFVCFWGVPGDVSPPCIMSFVRLRAAAALPLCCWFWGRRAVLQAQSRTVLLLLLLRCFRDLTVQNLKSGLLIRIIWWLLLHPQLYVYN